MLVDESNISFKAVEYDLYHVHMKSDIVYLVHVHDHPLAIVPMLIDPTYSVTVLRWEQDIQQQVKKTLVLFQLWCIF